MTGGVVSRTTTWFVEKAVFPKASAILMTTLLVPKGRIEPAVTGNGRNDKTANDKEHLDAQPAGLQQSNVHFGKRPLQRMRDQHA